MGILVTGGAGYIGSHVAHALAERGEHVVVLDSFIRGFKGTTPGIDIVDADIGDAKKVQEMCRKYSIQEVFHFAGLKSVHESMKVPREYFRNNVEKMVVLLEQLSAGGIQNFVFSSSCAVYGNDVNGKPFSESSETRPISAYGESKLMAETILNRFSQEQHFKCLSLRYFNVVGADQSFLRGEDLLTSENLVPLLIKAVISGHRAGLGGTDYDTPDGTAMRDYLHIADLVSGHLDAIDYLRNDGDCRVVNLGSGKGVSVREVIASVASTAGVPVPHAFGERRHGDPAIVYADASLAKKIFGWVPRHTLTEAVASAWEWFHNAPINRRKEWMLQLSAASVNNYD